MKSRANSTARGRVLEILEPVIALKRTRPKEEDIHRHVLPGRKKSVVRVGYKDMFNLRLFKP
jgi:hypothetical protein